MSVHDMSWDTIFEKFEIVGKEKGTGTAMYLEHFDPQQLDLMIIHF